uniref:Uncharacterized protein n=1 Tax=Anguilla anguilla TaxID=7936 RepID=A0A0E9STQ9_ANGAN
MSSSNNQYIHTSYVQSLNLVWTRV